MYHYLLRMQYESWNQYFWPFDMKLPKTLFSSLNREAIFEISQDHFLCLSPTVFHPRMTSFIQNWRGAGNGGIPIFGWGMGNGIWCIEERGMLNSERRMGFGYVLMNLSEWGMVNESRESKCSTILTIVVTVNSCSPFNTLHLSQPFKSQSFMSHYHSQIITIYSSPEIGK